MEVVNNPINKYTLFKDVKCGDVFIYQGKPYIKMVEIVINNIHIFNAIDTEGLRYSFGKETEVLVATRAKLVIDF